MSAASSRDVFEAIVSELDDPEAVLIRRKVVSLGAAVYVCAMVVTVLAGFGWPTLVAFSSTFVPSMVVARTIAGRRIPHLGNAPRPGILSSRRRSRP